MAFRTYLFFSGGACAAAFERYAKVFGGELTLVRTTDMPEGERPADVPDDFVMHATLMTGDGVLLGSDDPTGDGGPKVGFSVSWTAVSGDEARRVFDALAEGGDVTMPMTDTSWAPAFGMVTDRFGVPWMIDAAG